MLIEMKLGWTVAVRHFKWQVVPGIVSVLPFQQWGNDRVLTQLRFTTFIRI